MSLIFQLKVYPVKKSKILDNAEVGAWYISVNLHFEHVTVENFLF